MNKNRNQFFLTVLIVLAISMMWTVPVLADEGEPQTEEPVATETTPVEEPPAAEDEPAETVDSLPAEPVSEETVPAEDQADPAPAEETVVAEETLLEQLPEDTTIVVVDENGDPLSLATQEAAEAVATMPDPQWCPVGAMPGSATCSPSFGSFTNGGLLNWLTTNNPGVAGVIWIEASYNSTTASETGAIVLDGGTLTNMANFALTINGGWNGPGTNTMNPLDPSEFNVPFSISGWTGAITLNNLLIQNVTGASTIVMGVWTDGNITVNNVDVVNNTTEWGAYLDNNDDPAAVGNVVVNDSTFNNNTGTSSWGLVIWSNGTITLKNVTANYNTGDGLQINNTSAATPKNCHDDWL